MMSYKSIINNKTSYIGLLGNPLQHSYSAYLHNAVLQLQNINAVYLPLVVSRENLESVINGIRNLNFLGANVTIPFKEVIIPLLDDISQEAKAFGSVNVIKLEGNSLIGYNTDGIGYKLSLEANNVDINGLNGIILGAGGAASSIALTMVSMGIKHLSLVDIELIRAKRLVDRIIEFSSGKTTAEVFNLDEFNTIASSADIVVNTTPVGMHPNICESPIKDIEVLKAGVVLFDIVYNPQYTAFLKMGKRRNMKIINGMEMFVFQAAYTYSILLDSFPPIDLMKSLMRDLLEREGIYFN